MLVSRPQTIPKILGGEARGRKKVRLATKWDRVRKQRLARARTLPEMADAKPRGGTHQYDTIAPP
jgi:hypothetical protein